MTRKNKQSTAKVIPIRQKAPIPKTKCATVAHFAKSLEEKLRTDFIYWAEPIPGLYKKEKSAVWEQGRRLLKVRELIGHGHWKKFVDECLPYKIRTAQNYMKLAREFPDAPPADDRTYRELYTGKQQKNLGALAEEFGQPPFDVLDGRSPRWKARKRFWLELGIRGELGRDTAPGGAPMPIDREEDESGTSVFDPVLCELMYRWFCPPGGRVLDPFAGGSVRGIVAAAYGLHYTGFEIRPEQVEANYQNWEEVAPKLANQKSLSPKQPPPQWCVADSKTLRRHRPIYDLIFTCPPYYDLEKYSDLPGELSAMNDDEFHKAYTDILESSLTLLKKDRFAILVLSDVRDWGAGFETRGLYRTLVTETDNIMAKYGCGVYNKAILLTPLGSAPIRAARQFRESRKMTSVYQSVRMYIAGHVMATTEMLALVDGPGEPIGQRAESVLAAVQQRES